MTEKEVFNRCYGPLPNALWSNVYTNNTTGPLYCTLLLVFSNKMLDLLCSIRSPVLRSLNMSSGSFILFYYNVNQQWICSLQLATLRCDVRIELTSLWCKLFKIFVVKIQAETCSFKSTVLFLNNKKLHLSSCLHSGCALISLICN